MDITKFAINVNVVKNTEGFRMCVRVPRTTADMIGPVYFTGDLAKGLKIVPCKNGGKKWSGAAKTGSRTLSLNSDFFGIKPKNTTRAVSLTVEQNDDGSYVAKPFDIRTAPARKPSRRSLQTSQQSLMLTDPKPLNADPQNTANSLLRVMNNAHLDPTILMEYDGKPFDVSKMGIFAIERKRLM